ERRLQLRNMTPGSANEPPQQVTINAGGSFTATSLLPGKYVLGGSVFFGADAASVTWTIQSVTIDGRDVTDLPFEVRAAAPPKDVLVTFTDRWQEVSGRLVDADGASAPGYTVLMFPGDKSYWMTNTRRIVTTRPDTSGQFRMGGPGPFAIPPGDYL